MACRCAPATRLFVVAKGAIATPNGTYTSGECFHEDCVVDPMTSSGSATAMGETVVLVLQVVMACIVMACIVMAYIIMVYIIMDVAMVRTVKLSQTIAPILRRAWSF